MQFKHSARDIRVLHNKNYMKRHKQASICAQGLVKLTRFGFNLLSLMQHCLYFETDTRRVLVDKELKQGVNFPLASLAAAWPSLGFVPPVQPL